MRHSCLLFCEESLLMLACCHEFLLDGQYVWPPPVCLLSHSLTFSSLSNVSFFFWYFLFQENRQLQEQVQRLVARVKALKSQVSRSLGAKTDSGISAASCCSFSQSVQAFAKQGQLLPSYFTCLSSQEKQEERMSGFFLLLEELFVVQENST